MSRRDADIKELNDQITDYQRHVDMRDTINRLSDNPDFKKLIREEYMINETARLAQFSADPNLDAKQQSDALAMAQASGHLKRFLSAKISMGNNAETNIRAAQNAILELQNMSEEEILAYETVEIQD